jgi:branched-chain amino acid transport system ATP-binding protein
MSDQGNMLETRQLSKSFGGVSAVKAVDLRVAEGELHAIIGPNGAGKTTLFHLLTGVYPATSGQVLFRGRDITAMPANQRVVAGMSRSYQRTNIFPNLTVEENLLAAAERAVGRRWSLSWRGAAAASRSLAQEVIDQLSLGDFAGTEADLLPYGAQRLVDIGIALCCRPQLLLLDEPTSGLSTAELAEAVSVLGVLRQRYTIILIEHNMQLVMGVADSASVLNFGERIAGGTPEEIGRIPAVQEAYFGKRRGVA